MSAHTIWGESSPLSVSSLPDKARVDIAIVGAGVAGLTVGYLLTRQGYDVHILDADAPSSGMTARSTAHISNAIDDGWRTLVARKGVGVASQVATAYKRATSLIEHTVQEESIACDYAHCDGFLTGGVGDLKDLKEELEAAQHVGIDVAWSMLHPFRAQPDGATLRFARQARLHPMKYTQAVLNCILRDGGHVHRARVTRVSPGRGTVAQITTASGGTLTVKTAVILATHDGLWFPPTCNAQSTYTSYVMAARVRKGTAADAVCWDLEDPYHYTRLQPGRDCDYLIFGGEDHETSKHVDANDRFAALEAWAQDNLPKMDSIAARWSGEIRQPADNLGFLGRDPNFEGIYIIDGDSGLGFTHATVGAEIVSEMIAGRDSAWMSIFDPQRYGPARHKLVSDTQERLTTSISEASRQPLRPY